MGTDALDDLRLRDFAPRAMVRLAEHLRCDRAREQRLEPCVLMRTDDDEVGTYLTGEPGDRVSRTVRRHLKRRELRRHPVTLEVVDLPLQIRLNFIRGLLSGVDND